MRQSTELCFDGVCCLLCPVEQVYEEFLDHRNDQPSTGQELNRAEPSGSMNIMSDEMLRDFCPDCSVERVCVHAVKV